MDATLKLKEPFTINESYDQALYEAGSISFAKWDGDRAVFQASIWLRPFKVADGKKVYGPADRSIEIRIADLDAVQTDPLLEDARQKLKQAHGLMQMAANVVKGLPPG